MLLILECAGITENLNGLSIDWVHVSPGVARLHPASRFLLINEMLAFCVDTRPVRATSIHCRTTESDEDLVHALEENEFDLANTISDSEFQERMGLANALRWKTQKQSESAKLVIPKSNVYTYLVPCPPRPQHCVHVFGLAWSACASWQVPYQAE